MKRAILVVGAPRSGTSVVSHVLNRLGVNFGDPERFIDVKKNKHNPNFFELQELNAINDDIFLKFNKKWAEFDWHPLASDFSDVLIASLAVRIKQFIELEFGNSNLIGLKDPRFCFTLPVWSTVLSNLGYKIDYVFTERNPSAVFSSNAIVNNFPKARNFRITVESILVASYFLRNKPVVHVKYESLLGNPEIEVKLLCERLALESSSVSPACSIIDQELNHGINSSNEVFFKYFDCLSIYRSDLVSKYERFREVALSVASERDEQIASLEQVVSERDEQIASLNQEISERDEQIASLNQEISKRDEQIASLEQVVSERDEQIASLNQEISKRDMLVNQIYNSTSWRVTRPLRAFKMFFFKRRCVENSQNDLPGRFDIKWYLKQNPDVANSGMDPFEHYVRYGRKEGRQAAPDPFGRRIIKRMQIIKIALHLTIKESNGGVISTIIAILKRQGWRGVRNKIISQFGRAQVLQTNGFDRNDYTEWIRRYDSLTNESRDVISARIKDFSSQPLISVVMPTYNPKPEWLIEAIESVRKQLYNNWQLCIADDASTDKAIRPILERYAMEDPRIKVVFREENGHISAASNSALELATGKWVALLDHDDLLSEHALYWVADAIEKNPDVRLIYSDEDKIDEAGKRFAPYFKCDWNVDLFYSHNLISHLGVYRTDLLKNISGFRVGLEGSQDYDLALRCIEVIEPKQIHHIPKVLYHWRVHPESTAQSVDTKPYATLAGEKALNEHFQRQKINARSEFIGHGYRTHYALPDNTPMVSLIVPTRNKHQLLRQCLESIFEKTTYHNYEILVVDNGSDDPATLLYLDELQNEKRVRVLRDDRPFNYAALNNDAVKLARGEVLGLINNDLEVITPEWLTEMVSIAMQPQVGAVGARLWYPNETLQHAGVILGVGGVAGHSHKNLPRHQVGYFGRASLSQGFSAVTAACLLIRKEIYEQIGGLNDTDLHVTFNDIDFCLRVREAGYRNIWTPFAELYHHESASRGIEDTPEKQARFAKEVSYMQQHWADQLLYDPAYSPNLTLDHEDFSLAWPPRINLI